MSISPEDLIMQADIMNVRLEIVRGLPIWEASPVAEHQLEVDRIRASITANRQDGCKCIHLADVLFRFPDSSLKHPDIAILCALPKKSKLRNALNEIPEAVIEIISEGYERKDLELAPEFYLAMGVKDVVIFDPQTHIVYHHRKDGRQRLESPTTITFECGCACDV
jgi:Uma2 family endonuclease